jgi:aldehyde dehydrogenase (NAD+)
MPVAELAVGQVAYTFSGNLIAGQWRDGRAGGALSVTDPYDGVRLAEIPYASAGDVDDAYVAARAAQVAWGAAVPMARAAVLRRASAVWEGRKPEIVDWLIREAGSVRIKAEMEWGAVLAVLDEAACLPTRMHGATVPGDMPGKEHFVFRRPVGVVGVITPWNWPAHLTARSLAPALALGNAVVLKPAGATAVTGGLLFGRIFEEAGLPPGVLSVVVGRSEEIGDAFVSHAIPRVISFTGSTAVGRHIASLAATGTHLKHTLLELGGNGPLIVLDDADVDLAVRAAIIGKFLHQGQICIIANRLLVDASVYDRFVEQYVERARQLKIGNPHDVDTVIGPIISQHQLDGLLALIATARREGARELLGASAQGLVLPPHIFAVTEGMSLGQSEIFGPIAPIERVRGEEDAIRRANATDHGLSSALFSRDEGRAMRVARRIEAGMTHINDMSVIDVPYLPFGGEKNSGLGRFGANGVLQAFTTEHWISVQHTPRPYPF